MEVLPGWAGGDGSRGRWRGKRESLRRVRALMAPLTTSSVMVSLALWLLWNCRPALYSWGLRGDKRPFNSERREVTEKEALREGYQSDIHHTNLSLGTGPARERPWRWSWACMCASVWGWGDTARMGWWLQGGEEERGGTGLLRCPSCHSAEWRGVERWCWGVNLVVHFFFSMSPFYLCTFFSRFIFFISRFFAPFMASFQLTVNQQAPQTTRKKLFWPFILS